MMRPIIAALAAVPVLLAAPLSAQNDASAHAFAKRAVAQLEAAMPEASFEIEPGEPLQINIANTPRFDEGAVNLHRVYGFCLQASAEDCEAELNALIALVQEAEPQSGVENLRIIVRDAEYWSYIVASLPADDLPIHRQIGEDLFAILAIDSPDQISVAGASTIVEMGLDEGAAWDRAASQTRNALPQLPVGSAFAEQFFAFEGAEYMSSMLFDITAWQDIAKIVGPDLFATATSDQFVLFGALPAGQAFEEIKQAVVDDCNSAPRCISPNVYRFRDGAWVIARD